MAQMPEKVELIRVMLSDTFRRLSLMHDSFPPMATVD